MARIAKPGIYRTMSTDEYFADCCPQPSLTQSVAKILLDKSPRHAWQAHPRLNPDFRADDDRKFDIGNIAHALMIGRGKTIEVIEGFDDWRTKAAKEARDAAAAQGKLGVLGKHYAKAAAMVDAAREQLTLQSDPALANLFSAEYGAGEVVTAWQEGEIWFRQMIDWLQNDSRVFADYKTTDMSAAPHGIGKMMVNAGWPIQAAMGSRGLDVLDPGNAGRRRFFFIVQEAERPYALTVAEISEGTLTMGRKQLDMAAQIWRHSVQSDRWPGYPAEIVRPEYPGWHESQVLSREIEHDERQKRRPAIAADHLMGG